MTELQPQSVPIQSEMESRREDPSEKYRLIYEEIGKARERQFEDINLINQKLNWVLVSGCVVFVGFLQVQNLQLAANQLIASFLFLSMITCLYSLFPNDYKSGPNSASILAKQDAPYETVIQSLNKRITQDINSNKKIISKLNKALALSTALLIFSMSIILYAKYG